MRVEGNKVLGLLKVGMKKLFIRNEAGTIKEITPMCVLDFYVHESVQRGGQGRLLFEKML
jgi:alpha-tubulin N-acetyltransferase 1